MLIEPPLEFGGFRILVTALIVEGTGKRSLRNSNGWLGVLAVLN